MIPLEAVVWCYGATTLYIALWIDHFPSFIYQRPKIDTSFVTLEDIKEGRVSKIANHQSLLLIQYSPYRNCPITKSYYQLAVTMGFMWFAMIPEYVHYPYLLLYFIASVQYVRHAMHAYQYEDEKEQWYQWEKKTTALLEKSEIN